MRRAAGALGALGAILLCTGAHAHSASDAYLTLSVAPDPAGGTLLHGQWDIALRDLNFVLGLDDDGNGQVTWLELKRHRAAIERFAYAGLGLAASGASCRIAPLRQVVDGHADGTYAALFFDVRCARPAKSLAIAYSLFFSVDPSHRGIFVLHSGADTATAVLSPQNAKIEVPLQGPGT